MKKPLLSSMLLFVSFFTITKNISAQCEFISPTVDVTNIQSQGATNCEVTFNLSFDIVTNSGNKYIFLHLWPSASYPNLDYSCNQCQPTASDLSGTVLNMVINNFTATPAFLSTYGPAPSVPVITPTNMTGLQIQKVASSTLGAERFIISNIKVLIPQACTSAINFTGDAWSSNANSTSSSVQCAMEGIQIGTNEPTVNSVIKCSSTGNQYSFSISTITNTKDVFYDVYLDDGNGVFEPANDILINSLPSTSPITVTPTTPYNSGLISYPTQYQTSVYYARKIFVVVGAVGQTYLSLKEANPPSCIVTPLTLISFNAKRNTADVVLNWETVAEIDTKEFVIQKKSGNDFIDIASVPTKNEASGAKYSYTDYNNTKETQYRLKMVDIDGKATYSDIRVVKAMSGTSDFIISPNPSKGEVKVTLADISSSTNVQLIDNNGRVVKDVRINNTNVISFTGLASGVYMIRVVNGNSGQSITKKLSVIQ